MRGEKQMNRKEKKAVGLLKALNNLEKKCKIEKVPYKSEIKKIMISLLPEDYGIFEILLNLIEKLQKENEELKNNTRKNENELEFDVDCDWIALQKILNKSEKSNEYISYKNEKWINEKYCIPIQKIKNKMKKEIETNEHIILGGRRNGKTLEYGKRLGRIEMCQELLEGRK